MRWLLLLACVLGCGDGGRELADLRARVESLEKNKAATEKQVESLRAAIAKPVAMPAEIECDRVVAKMFALEGPEGRILGSWYTGTMGPVISIKSLDGKSQSMMLATDDTASIFAQRSDKRMLITSRQDGATMAMAEEGTTDKLTNGRAAIGIGPTGNALMGLKNSDGDTMIPPVTDEPRRSPAPSPP